MLLAGMKFGVKGIAFSLVIVNWFSTFINIVPNKSIINYGCLEQLKDLFENAIAVIVMGVIVFQIGKLKLMPILLLIIQVFCGAGIYLVLSILFKIDSFYYLIDLAKRTIFAHRIQKRSDI